MSQKSREQMRNDEAPQRKSPVEQQGSGSLTVEDDPDGTVDPADLAGSATPDDAKVGPEANEADGR